MSQRNRNRYGEDYCDLLNDVYDEISPKINEELLLFFDIASKKEIDIQEEELHQFFDRFQTHYTDFIDVIFTQRETDETDYIKLNCTPEQALEKISKDVENYVWELSEDEADKRIDSAEDSYTSYAYDNMMDCGSFSGGYYFLD